VLISTFAGHSSKWLEDGLIEQVRSLTDVPVEHFESNPAAAAAAGAAVAGGVG
jgi:hypothetical protein